MESVLGYDNLSKLEAWFINKALEDHELNGTAEISGKRADDSGMRPPGWPGWSVNSRCLVSMKRSLVGGSAGQRRP